MYRKLFLILIISGAFAGCGGENAKDTKETHSLVDSTQLEGNWQIYYAERSSVPTGVLQNTFFSFTVDSMETNMPTQAGRSSYSWIDGSIVREAQPPSFYEVKKLNKDSLTMHVELEGFNFELFLQRTPEGE
jgi:hypothetical protein